MLNTQMRHDEPSLAVSTPRHTPTGLKNAHIHPPPHHPDPKRWIQAKRTPWPDVGSGMQYRDTSFRRERTRSILGDVAAARDLRAKLRVPVVRVQVATYLKEERDLAGTQLVALAPDHLRSPISTLKHSWTTSFLRAAILARSPPYVMRC